MRIHIEIDRLLLKGFRLTPTERIEMIEALQLELERLITTEGNSQAGELLRSQPQISARPITFRPESNPSKIGREIAASLHTGLQSESKTTQGLKT